MSDRGVDIDQRSIGVVEVETKTSDFVRLVDDYEEALIRESKRQRYNPH